MNARRERGFSLVEMLVALTILLIGLAISVEVVRRAHDLLASAGRDLHAIARGLDPRPPVLPAEPQDPLQLGLGDREPPAGEADQECAHEGYGVEQHRSDSCDMDYGARKTSVRG